MTDLVRIEAEHGRLQPYLGWQALFEERRKVHGCQSVAR
jgi:hypothetical protein